MDKLNVNVGDKVRVYDINGKREGWGDGVEGTVTKVGRALFTVEHRQARPGGQVFKLEGGWANDKWGHRWVETEEQFAARKRRDDAVTMLESRGIRLEPTSKGRLTTEILEALAAAAAGFPRESGN